MISEIIIAFTLFVNAGAVLNFKVTRRKDEDEFMNSRDSPSFGEKIRDFLEALRYFRAFIGLWNFFIMFLMLVNEFRYFVHQEK